MTRPPHAIVSPLTGLKPNQAGLFLTVAIELHLCAQPRVALPLAE
jgi:hypothetical protein